MTVPPSGTPEPLNPPLEMRDAVKAYAGYDLYEPTAVQADHICSANRVRGYAHEGDDAITEWCEVCGRFRFEPDGVRPMAWYVDPRNPTGMRYAYSDPKGSPDAPTIWKHAPAAPPD